MLSLTPEKSNLCQFWVSVTLKPFRISQNWPRKYLIWVENYWSTKFWTEQNSCEYIIVTQIWYKCVIGSWPPKNGKIAPNSMTYKFQITYDRKLKFSGFISVTERFISAKFYQNSTWSPWELRKYWMIWFGMTLILKIFNDVNYLSR